MGNTHYLHRSKAITCYVAARDAIHKGLGYPAYMMLKESLRATLAYACEIAYKREYKEKTKLNYLLGCVPDSYVTAEQAEIFNKLLVMESGGLEDIIATDIDTLRGIKSQLKRVISVVFGEQVV